ncbi:hypothetical protein MF4640_09165 [Acinetobacter sp. MF4640]|nr:hypothetical protein MF4640_09165 [Acinetobacter sp. MF4640]
MDKKKLDLHSNFGGTLLFDWIIILSKEVGFQPNILLNNFEGVWLLLNIYFVEHSSFKNKNHPTFPLDGLDHIKLL